MAIARELTHKASERKVTLPPAQRAYGPEGTVNSEPVNGYRSFKGLPEEIAEISDHEGLSL